MTKIALIDENLDYCDSFYRLFKNSEGSVTTFSTKESCENASEFKDFDMIYVDSNLGWSTGEKLIECLSFHTDADFALITNSRDPFTKKNVDDPRISAILMKENQQYLLEWYNDTRKKRNILKGA